MADDGAIGSVFVRIGIDDMPMTHGLRNINQQVRILTNSWKAQETYLKNVGDQLGAAKARFDGLSDVIDKQKQAIEELKSSQASALTNINKAKDSIAELKVEMAKEAEITGKSSDAYKKLQRALGDATGTLQKQERTYNSLGGKVEAAKNKLASFITQQKKAQTSMSYYATGADKVQKSLKEISTQGQALVDKLRAEGKEYEADAAQSKMYSDELKKMSELHAKLTEQLNDVAQTQGKDSDAYHRVSDSLAKLDVQMAKTAKKQADLQVAMDKYANGTTKVKKSLDELKEDGDFYIEKLKAEGHEYQANYEQGKLYDAELSKMADLHKRLETSLQGLAEIQGKDSEAYRDTKVQLEKLDVEMAKTEASQDKLKESFSNTHIIAAKLHDAYDDVDKGLHEVGTGIKESFGKLAAGAAVAGGAIAGMSGTFMLMSNAASKLKSTYGELSNMLVARGEKTAEVTHNITEMQKDGRHYSVEYGISQQQIADAYSEMINRGDSSTQALGSMNSVLQASIATHTDLADAVNVSSEAMEAFGLKLNKDGQPLKSTKTVVDRTSKAITEMSYVTTTTATNFKDLGLIFSYAGATAHSAGISLGDLSSAAGVLAKNGIEGSKAGTGLRKILLSLEAPTAAAKQALKSLGISTSQLIQKNGKMKSLAQIFGLLGQKTAKLNAMQKGAIFKALFGATGENAAILLAKNNEELAQLDAGAEKAAKNDFLGKLAAKDMKTAQNAENQFKQAAAAIGMELSADVLPAVVNAADAMARFMDTRAFENFMNVVNHGFQEMGHGLSDVFRWIGNNSQALGSIDTSIAKIIGELASGVWSGFSSILGGIAKGMMMAFGQKSTGDTAKDVATALADIASHKEAIEDIGRALATYFIAKKAIQFAGGLFTIAKGLKSIAKARDDFKSGKGLLESISGVKDFSNIDHEVTADTAKIATDASLTAEKTASKSTFAEKLLTVSSGAKSNFLKSFDTLGGLASHALTIGLGAFDIGKAVLAKSGRAKAINAGKGMGTLIGGGIGAVFGGPEGAFLGGQIGHAIGGFAGKEINKFFSHYHVTPPKISMKKTYDDLLKQANQYVVEQKKILESLYKDGAITKKEYEIRLKAMQNGEKQLNNTAKLSGSDRTALAKYYAGKRAKLESSYDKKIAAIKAEWNSKDQKDQKKYGMTSEKLAEDEAHKKEAIQKEENAKKYALEQQAYQFTSKTTIAEAKLHETLAGKEKLALTEELKDFDEFKNRKGKMSDELMQHLVNNAKQQEEKAEEYAESEYKHVTDVAKEQKDRRIKAALETYEQTKKANEEKYQDAVQNAYLEYQGTSNYAVQQRDKLIENANETKERNDHTAYEKYQSVKSSADHEYESTRGAAKKQKESEISNAKSAYQSVTEQAKAQSRGVVSHATAQANSTMKANYEEGHGVESIWHKIISFFNSLTKVFGIKAIHTDAVPLTLPRVGGLAYAKGTGSSGATASGMALVGEAGPELHYQPYSGTYDIVGTRGAELVNLHTGDQILNAHDTAQLFSGNYEGTLPGFASGTTSLSDFIKKMKGKATNFFKHVGKDAKKIFDKIDDPIKYLGNLAKKAFNLDSVANIGKIPEDLAKGIVKKTIHSIGDFINKLKGEFTSSLDITAKNIGPGVKNWEPIIEQVAKATHTHVSASDMAALLARIQKESGGNQAIRQQVWDVNMANGDPAEGLFQYIPPTFAAWAVPGHTNILSGKDQIYAVFNDSNWRSDIRMPGGWGPTGHKVFANGGIATSPSIFGEAGAEMAIPLATAKRSRGYELLGQLVTMFSKNVSVPNVKVQNNNEQIETLLIQNNQLMETLINIVGNMAQQGNTANVQVLKNAFYTVFGNDQRKANFQTF